MPSIVLCGTCYCRGDLCKVRKVFDGVLAELFSQQNVFVLSLLAWQGCAISMFILCFMVKGLGFGL